MDLSDTHKSKNTLTLKYTTWRLQIDVEEITGQQELAELDDKHEPKKMWKQQMGLSTSRDHHLYTFIHHESQNTSSQQPHLLMITHKLLSSNIEHTCIKSFTHLLQQTQVTCHTQPNVGLCDVQRFNQHDGFISF